MEPNSLRQSLTDKAAQAWQTWVKQGDSVLDATAGNGHDTCALAEQVGPNGKVFAIDIQSDALKSTKSRLQSKQLLDRTILIEANHANLISVLPSEAIGRLSLVCFNLGYLPGGNHDLVTSAESTIKALEAAAEALSPSGVLSVIAYRAHSGALEEYERVEHFFASRQANWQVHAHEKTGGKRLGPVWWLASQAG